MTLNLPRPGIAEVLVDDPDLAAELSGPRLRRARREARAATIVALPGAWTPEPIPPDVRNGIGLLVLDGLILAQSSCGGRRAVELIGPGDIVRPWQCQQADATATLPLGTAWQVLQPARMAVLDVRFAARMGPYPEVGRALVGRALQRSRMLVFLLAAAHCPRVDTRLLLLFWRLADRWGTVTPSGIRLPLALTHTVLGDLVAARRPSVSTALQHLAAAGKVTPLPQGGWLLHGSPPDGLLTTGRPGAAALVEG